MKKGKIIVFSAASGAGKTTILDYLRKAIPELVYSISATTRKPRFNEIDGLHYFFYKKKIFLAMIKKNEFAEWAEVHGNYYGTPRKFIDEAINSGKNIVMDIDVYGKTKFDLFYPDAIGIFVMPPSIKQLEKRLKNRMTDSDDVIKIRLENAINEITYAENSGKYEHWMINDNLEICLKKTEELILTLVNVK